MEDCDRSRVEPGELLDVLGPRGGILTGVPCSLLASLIAAARSDARWRYVPATGEGEAVAIASGTRLAGGDAVVVLQNSGLGQALDPLVSLTVPFGVALPLVVSHRGHPAHETLPQHRVTGRITEELIGVAGIPSVPLDAARLPELWELAWSGSPFAVVVGPGVLGDGPGPPPAEPARTRPVHVPGGEEEPRPPVSRQEAIDAILAAAPASAVLVATTGHASRQLFATRDADTHLYLSGSMGYAGACGVGVALQRPDIDVVVLDGDGAALMHLGNLATAAAFGGPRLRHVILDNGAHASTGGQPTASPGVSFAALAAALGYRSARSSRSFAGTADAVEWAFAAEGPVLLELEIDAGVPPGLPRVEVDPAEQARRFVRALAPMAVAT